MAKISEIEIPKLLFDEGAAPGTPAATNVALYAKADGLLYSKDDAGVETAVSGGTAGTPAFVGCLAKRTTDQTGVVTAVSTAVSFDGTDESDTDAFHDPTTNPSRITIPAGKAGTYIFSTYIIFDQNATGLRRVAIRKNATGNHYGLISTLPLGTEYTHITISTPPVAMAVADYMEVFVMQNSGGNRTLTGSVVPMQFGCTLIGT